MHLTHLRWPVFIWMRVVHWHTIPYKNMQIQTDASLQKPFDAPLLRMWLFRDAVVSGEYNMPVVLGEIWLCCQVQYH